MHGVEAEFEQGPNPVVGPVDLAGVRGVGDDVTTRPVLAASAGVSELVVGNHAAQDLQGCVALVGVGGGELDALDQARSGLLADLTDADHAVKPVPEPAVAFAVVPGVGVGQQVEVPLVVLRAVRAWIQLVSDEVEQARHHTLGQLTLIIHPGAGHAQAPLRRRVQRVQQGDEVSQNHCLLGRRQQQQANEQDPHGQAPFRAAGGSVLRRGQHRLEVSHQRGPVDGRLSATHEGCRHLEDGDLLGAGETGLAAALDHLGVRRADRQGDGRVRLCHLRAHWETSIAAHEYVVDQNSSLDPDERRHLQAGFATGYELVDDTARLAAMNMLLDGIGIGTATGESPIVTGDALRTDPGKRYSMCLANPPFGKSHPPSSWGMTAPPNGSR